MSQYKAEPRVMTSIAVKAGGKFDPADATGLAHYLEHIMFKGTSEFGTQNGVRRRSTWIALNTCLSTIAH